jgi:hypothetical protein
LSDTGEYVYSLLWRDSGQADLKIEGIGRNGSSKLFERIIWTGREVWQYDSCKKEISVMPMDEVDEHETFRGWIRQSWWNGFVGNSFDLVFPTLGNPREVDPLPFLMGMKAVVGKNLFKFERLGDSESQGVVFRATPLDPQLRSSFNGVLITLDKERRLPVVVEYRRGWKNRDIRQYPSAR